VRRAPALAVAAAASAALLLSACSGLVDPLGPPSGSGAPGGAAGVVVGSGTSTESTVVAALYARALTAKGVTASTRLALGNREAYLAALVDGSVSLVPECTGSLLLHYDDTNPATTAAEVQAALPEVLPAGVVLGKPSAARDQAVYVVTRQFSRAHRVTSLADLAAVPGRPVLGGPTGLPTQPYGPEGLRQVYGARLGAFRPDDSPAQRSRDLDAGRIGVAGFSSTEPVIADKGYVVLGDPQAMIRPQNLVPLMRSTVAADPAVVQAVDGVQAALTTAELSRLDEAVDVGGQAPDVVAGRWLSSKGLA